MSEDGAALSKGTQSCETEACDREATHRAEYPDGKHTAKARVCVTCLHALEAGMNADVDDRRDMEVECL